MARPYLVTGRWISWEGCASKFLPKASEDHARFPHKLRVPCLVLEPIPDKILQIHTLERECRLSLRWKTGESSEAKATAPKASATAKSFLILPLLATRKSSPILLTQGRSLS